jgi:hypothetical protein
MSASYLRHLGILEGEGSPGSVESLTAVQEVACLFHEVEPVSFCSDKVSTSRRKSLNPNNLHENLEIMADWVHRLCPWEVIAHLTFRWECSLESGRRCFERFMRKHHARLSYFYALEANGHCSDRTGFHVHALWGDCQGVFRKEAWATWFKRYGRARIEPVRSKGDVSGYCSKYVTKEGAWWNVKLQWHRVEAINERKYELER